MTDVTGILSDILNGSANGNDTASDDNVVVNLSDLL